MMQINGGLRITQSIEHDGAALRRERIRDREPNAAGTTRHQRGLVAEHLVSFLPNFRRNRNDPEQCRPVSGG